MSDAACVNLPLETPVALSPDLHGPAM
jgi:hypothetical protein